MNKKAIIGTTFLFVFMMAFIMGFNVVFGMENILIGISTITAVLMFLGKDFSLNPVSTAVKLIIFNVLMGIVTFLASQNAILGIPLNFIFVFIIGYTLCYNLNTPSFVPFNLQYVFLLFATVTLDQLPKRLLSLAVGAVIIVLSQVLFNKNKIYKQGNSVLSGVCSNIVKKVELLEKNESITELDNKIKNGINTFRKFVYNRREQQFYFTDESKIKLNISLELEKINSALNELAEQKDAVHILNEDNFKEDFLDAINAVKACLEKDEKIDKLDKLFTDIFGKDDKKGNASVFKIKALNSLYFIRQSLDDLNKLDKKKYNIVRKLEEIPSNYKLSNIYKESFRSNSLRFSYAFRLALGITFSTFIVDFFNLEEGRWIVYTVNSLIQPFYEHSKEKMNDRLIATMIGIVIITIVFYFIKNPTARMLSTLIIGYLLSFSNTYRIRTITVTVSAIGAAALHGSSTVLSVERLVFVVTGTIISVILSKFVFPYNAEDARKYLISLYDKTIASQINIVKNLVSKNERADSAMKNEILRANMIEDRLLSNDIDDEDSSVHEYLDNQRALVMNISDLYRWIEVNDTDISLYDKEREKIAKLVKNKDNISYKELDEAVNHSGSNYSLSSKIAIIDYIEILVGINKVKKLNLKV